MQQTFGAIGQMSQMLAMNTDAMGYAFGAFAHFVERIGGAVGEIGGFVSGQPPPTRVDPQTGQPLPPLSPEEYQKERKKRVIRWIIGILVLAAGYKGLRMILRRLRPKKKDLEAAWGGANGPGMYRGGMMSPYGGSMSPYGSAYGGYGGYGGFNNRYGGMM